MKKILIAISILLLVGSCQLSVVSAQDVKGQTSKVKSNSEELKDYEAYNYAETIDKDIEQYKKSFDQRVQEIKYVLGLVGITSENTLEEAIGKDATCLRLDTAIRLLQNQRKNLADKKVFKKVEKKKE